MTYQLNHIDPDEIDRLRFKAFKTNAPEDTLAYYKAASAYFQDRHVREMIRADLATSMRCAECDCERGGADCNWIATPTPAVYLAGRHDERKDTPAPAVKVKALVWEERRNGYWQAVGTGYQIAHNQGDVYRVRLGDKVICRRISDFENATQWVFNHHSATILAALEAATPLDDPRVKALVGATENLIIALGMGWDLDGVVSEARAALSALEENK